MDGGGGEGEVMGDNGEVIGWLEVWAKVLWWGGVSKGRC